MSKSLPWIQCHHGRLLQVSAAHPILQQNWFAEQRQVTPCDKMATLCVKMADFGHDMWISLQIIHWCGLCFMWFMLGPHLAPGDSETLAHGPQQKDLTASPWRSECFLRWCLQLSSNDVFHSIWMFTQLHSIPPHFVPFHSVRFSLNFIPLHSISLRLILFLSQFNAFYSMDRIPFRSVRSVPIHSLQEIAASCLVKHAAEDNND